MPRRRLLRPQLALLAAFVAAGCSPLSAFNTLVPKDITGKQIARDLRYGAHPRQMLDIYAPRGAAAGSSRPVVVFFYGGSWNSGTRRGYSFVGRALASRGFVTVIPDYRLVPEVRYPGFVEDGAAAVRWARDHAATYGGNPHRIVLVGHSAGAYIAAMLALDPRWLGDARDAVRGFAGLAGPYDFTPFDVAASRAAFGDWPDPAATQPVTWAGAGDPPTLLLVGGKDTLVSPRNSETLAQKLRAGGVRVDLRRYPGLGHVGMVTTIARPLRRRSAPVLDDLARFINCLPG